MRFLSDTFANVSTGPPAILTSHYHSSFATPCMVSIFISADRRGSGTTKEDSSTFLFCLASCSQAGYCWFVQFRLRLTCPRQDSNVDPPVWFEQYDCYGCQEYVKLDYNICMSFVWIDMTPIFISDLLNLEQLCALSWLHSLSLSLSLLVSCCCQ